MELKYIEGNVGGNLTQCSHNRNPERHKKKPQLKET